MPRGEEAAWRIAAIKSWCEGAAFGNNDAGNALGNALGSTSYAGAVGRNDPSTDTGNNAVGLCYYSAYGRINAGDAASTAGNNDANGAAIGTYAGNAGNDGNYDTACAACPGSAAGNAMGTEEVGNHSNYPGSTGDAGNPLNLMRTITSIRIYSSSIRSIIPRVIPNREPKAQEVIIRDQLQ